MVPELCRRLAAEQEVVAAFLAVLDYYNSHLSQPWYFACKLHHDNKHSLASATGLLMEEVLGILKILKVAKDYGKKGEVRIVRSVEQWRQADERLFASAFLRNNNAVNQSGSDCAGDPGIKHVFLLLGQKENVKKAKLPKFQMLVEIPPTTDFGTRRALKALKMTLRDAYNAIPTSQATISPPSTAPASSSSAPVTAPAAVFPASAQAPSLSMPEEESDAHGMFSEELLAESFIAERNATVIDRYKKIGYGEDADVMNTSVEVLKLKYPMLSVFHIPLAPIILRKLVNEIVQLQKANTTINILTNVDHNLHGGNHEHYVLPLLKPLNHRSFKMNCRKVLTNLPKNLVKGGVDDLLEEESKIRAWCIEALLDENNDDEVIRIVKKKLGLTQQVTMPAEQVGAMLKIANLTPTSFKAIKSFLQTYYGYQMFAAEYDVRKIYADNIKPIALQWKDSSCEAKVDFWYKDLTKILLLHSKDLYEVETDLLLQGKRFHILFSGDHGQEMMRFCIKILLVDSDADDGNVIDERSYSLGEIDGKDEYMPPLTEIFC